jgi:hypothetical protein
MKYGWNFEPTLVSEAVRQIVLMCILFGWIHWNDQQLAAVLMVCSALLALKARSQSVPVQTIHAAGTTAAELKSVANNPQATMQQVAVDNHPVDNSPQP